MPPDHSSDSVAVPVHIDNLSVFGYSVAAREIYIAHRRLKHGPETVGEMGLEVFDFMGEVESIDHPIASPLQDIDNPDRLHAR